MKENKNKIETTFFKAALDTPMREDAFEMSDDDKVASIEVHFRAIMETLGLDLTDDSLSKTPNRVAKMYVKEIFSGLNPALKPAITLFENKYSYNQMLVERNISVYSMCEHHFVPIIGKAHVAYIADSKVIGLSKIHRLVKYYARRPQVQERLTKQVMEALKSALNIEDVAVAIDARHMCVECRGVEDVTSSTVTSALSGQFLNESTRTEFLRYIAMS
ncbi:GTP cyclohydrolase I FolE [Bacteroidia bacterium]|nr:GTP cyclohydrolase I FolE [Bacteroidia bacterium]MDC1395687.1 GTP cyclohydrolase I FolE [Bacteroidia bacterium]